MEDCVRYAINPGEIRKALKNVHHLITKEELVALMAGSFLEVWEGLPSEYIFKRTVGAGGKPALRAESPGVYIWVMSDGCAVLEKNPKQILFALSNRCEDSLEVSCVVPVPEKTTILEAIAFAKERNRVGAPKALEYLRAQKQQSERRQLKIGRTTQ